MHYLKRVKPLHWFALLTIFISLSITIFITVDHSSSAEKLSNNVEGVAQNYNYKDIIVHQDLSEYPGLQLHTELKGLKEYALSISYPKTNIDAIDRSIVEWVDKQRTDFMDTIESNAASDHDGFRFHLNIQVETNEITEGIYNVVLNASHYTGDPNVVSMVKAFNFDVNQERHLTLTDFFLQPNSEAFKEKIAQEIERIISSNDHCKKHIDQELLQESIHSTEKWEWGITKDHFTTYHNTYEVGADTLDGIFFDIEIHQLDAYVKEDWLVVFEMEDEIEKREQLLEAKKSSEKEAKKITEKENQIENGGKYIALTFDDGPHPDVTPRILKTLAEFDAKATFFMLGLQVEYNPSLAAQVANEGHEIANHSHSHMDLTLLGHNQLIKEIANTNSKIENITGERPVLFRPPYGAYNDQVKNIAEQNGLSIILWSIDSLDWKNRNKNAVYTAVTANATIGSTVLLHDIHPTTADALPNVLATLSEQGYNFVTISKLMAIQGQSGVGPF